MHRMGKNILYMNGIHLNTANISNKLKINFYTRLKASFQDNLGISNCSEFHCSNRQ